VTKPKTSSKPSKTRKRRKPEVHISECGTYAWAHLTKGYVTYVDVADADLLAAFCWYAAISGYRADGTPSVYARRYAGKDETPVYLHRAITGCVGTAEVDHIDGDTLNNRRGNLRPTDPSGNAGNVPKRSQVNGRACSSRFKGVSIRQDGTIRAYIKVGYRQFHLGHFRCEEEAAKAYDRAAMENFGEFALTNAMLLAEGRL